MNQALPARAELVGDGQLLASKVGVVKLEGQPVVHHQPRGGRVRVDCVDDDQVVSPGQHAQARGSEGTRRRTGAAKEEAGLEGRQAQEIHQKRFARLKELQVAEHLWVARTCRRQ